MPSTFTSNTGIEKPGDGELTGQWGQTANRNFDIIDRALNGVLVQGIAGASLTLTTASGVVSDGQTAAVIFTGAVPGETTVTIAPNSVQKTYLFKNNSVRTVTITQGSGGNVEILPGGSAVVLCDGGGSTAAVTNLLAGLFDIATTLNLFQGTSEALVDAAGVYAASAPVTLTDGATVTPNFNAGRNFVLTLSGNRTLANPSSLIVGQTGVIVLQQDATGGRTIIPGSFYKFSQGAPTLSSAPNAIDVVGYWVKSSTEILCSFTRDFK